MKKHKLAFLAAGMTLSIISCQKEEEPIDMEAPKVALELSRNANKLYNEVTLTSTATDNGTIEKVEFFLNEQSLGEDKEAPYEFLWNTKEVEDGTYVLKAVASDNAGLKAEASQEVTVKNTLFVVNVEDGYLEVVENRESVEWIFLSDNDGNVVGEPQQVINGTILNWQRPEDFNSDIIYFNRLFYDYSFNEWSQRPDKYLGVNTYPNFPIDELNLKAYLSEWPEESVGKATVNIENDFDGSESYSYMTYMPYSGAGIGTGANSGSYQVTMYNDTEKAFSTYAKDVNTQIVESKYYRLDDFQVGNIYNFHTSEFTPMEMRTVSLPSEYNSFYFMVDGYLNQDDNWSYTVDNRSDWENEGLSEVNLFYADDFSHFFTYLSVRNEGNSFTSYQKGKAPASYTYPTYYASVSKDDLNQVQVTTRGSFDVGTASWENRIDDETQYYRTRKMIYFSGESGLTYTMPDIPSSLLEMYPELDSQMEHAFTYVLDHNHVNLYEELMEYWFTDKMADTEYTGYSNAYFYPSNQGARKLPEQKKLSQEEQKIQDNLRARGTFKY